MNAAYCETGSFSSTAAVDSTDNSTSPHHTHSHTHSHTHYTHTHTHTLTHNLSLTHTDTDTHTGTQKLITLSDKVQQKEITDMYITRITAAHVLIWNK